NGNVQTPRDEEPNADLILKDERVLTRYELAAVQENFCNLVENIDVSIELLNCLLSWECLTMYHVDVVKSRAAKYEMNEKLLLILMNRSFADFRKFIRSLYETNQSHVAAFIEEFLS